MKQIYLSLKEIRQVICVIVQLSRSLGKKLGIGVADIHDIENEDNYKARYQSRDNLDVDDHVPSEPVSR